jgi:hypothetical protein
MNPWSLSAVAITCAVTTIRVLLFGDLDMAPGPRRRRIDRVGSSYAETRYRVGWATLAVPVAIACSRKSDGHNSIERQIEAIREVTFPPGASGLVLFGSRAV